MPSPGGWGQAFLDVHACFKGRLSDMRQLTSVGAHTGHVGTESARQVGQWGNNSKNANWQGLSTEMLYASYSFHGLLWVGGTRVICWVSHPLVSITVLDILLYSQQLWATALETLKLSLRAVFGRIRGHLIWLRQVFQWQRLWLLICSIITVFVSVYMGAYLCAGASYIFIYIHTYIHTIFISYLV